MVAAITVATWVTSRARTMISDAIEGVLFDLGAVVINIDFERAISEWSRLSNRHADSLRASFSFDQAYEQHERGEIDAAAYFEALRRSLKVDLSDTQMLRGWNAIFVGEVPGMPGVLKRLATQTNLCAFTNSNKAHQQVWERDFAGVLQHFRTVFTSSGLGCRKPEANAFERVCERMGLAPERVLFFDDTEANVSGAKAVGLQAVLVRSIGDVDAALASHGFLT